ncbi:ABC transporter permease subunit [Paenibacillus rhizovicinus]|uniref:ABC transporter permease subunit n=1 Tax=Paenibacillus rhizovicinus TaxID=2704463 RepID=A0A6C0P009_9BACL|nr:ABC transporter permease [Paenibacillus rhizovicinus]QHW31253.1 ABC transporter permease subunit [Paenibacillus rhizovicinus]
MADLIACEWLKWRRSRMLWLVLLGALLPALLVFFITLNGASNDEPFHWKNYFETDLQIMAMLMCPALFSLLIGYMFAREFQERTVNNMLTGPHSRLSVLAAKFIITLPVLLAVMLLSFLLVLGSGFVFHGASESFTMSLLFDQAGKFGLLLLLEYALAPISAAVALLWRSYIPAMGLGIFAVISEMTIMQSKYIMYYPWSAILNLTTDLSPDHNSASIGYATLAIACVVPLFLIAAYFRRADVHSG